MRLRFLALVLLLPLSLRAQRLAPRPIPKVPPRLDSVWAWLRRPGLPDSVRVEMLVGASRLHMDTRLDSGQWYSEQAVALARRSGYARGVVGGLGNLAAAYYYASDYPAAQRTFEQLLRAAQALGEAQAIGNAYLGLGNVAADLPNPAAAQHYYALAQQTYATARPRLVQGELLVLHNRANGYLNANQPALARPLLRQGLALLRQHPRQGKIAPFLLKLGSAQRLQHQPDSALASWQQAAALAHRDKDSQTEGTAWNSLAELAQTQQRYPLALTYAQRANQLFRTLGDPDGLIAALDVQAAALAALRRPEAYDTLRRYTVLRDTLFNQERLEAVANAQARFDHAGQQARIRELEQQRRITALEEAGRRFQTRVELGALAGLGLLLGLWFVGAYRRRQYRREAALRHQLAADLHDDVGSLLSRIALQTDLLQEGLGEPAQQQAELAEVAGNSRLAVRQLNDVVWNLDAQNDSTPSLLYRLRDYAHELLVPTGRHVRFEADEGSANTPGLSPPVRRQLYLIYKEALHNILKYAPADATVTVRLHRAGNTLRLEVLNTGPVEAGAGRGSGHGLRNIHTRAEALGGRASTEPLPEGGFAVRVQVPC